MYNIPNLRTVEVVCMYVCIISEWRTRIKQFWTS